MSNHHPETPKSCPPKDVSSPSGVFYRVVYHNPPTSDDFAIWVLEPKNRHLLKERKSKRDCRSFAVSLCSTEEEGLRLCKLFKRALEKKAETAKAKFLGLAQVKLDANSGMIKQTGKNQCHHDLWPFITSKLECTVISVRSA